MIITSSKHILLVPAPSWGHLRPLASFAARLVHQRPDVIVTLTLMGSSQKMLENEIDRYFHNNEKPLKDNIRLLHIGGSEIKNPIQAFEEYTQGFAKMYPAAYAGEPLTCNLGRVFPGTSRPNVILLDNFFYDILQTVRKISGNSVPVLAWNTAALSSTFRFFGPPSLGGLGDVPPKAQTLAKETGKPLSEIYAQLYQPELGEIVKLPGLPEMYDYEFGNQHLDPQIVAFQCLTFPKVFDFFEQCDGIVALGNASFEPDVCAAFKTWFSPRPIYFVGPLLPDETPTKDTLSSSHEKELSVSSNGAEVKDFLDRIQKSHGDHSLLYVSFGSNFFPMGETIWKVIEVVLDMKIPLIFSFNPKKGEMPSHIQEQLKVTEIALVSNWAPQHAILAHNATGWFLTHCGNNSINEAASHGVPMIAWPLGGDQPSNAAYLSSTTNTAYELFETRLGVGLRPLYRGIKPKGTLEAVEEEVRSVFAKAWGADGAEKRKNAQALKKKLDIAWEENGEARVELVQFLDKFIPANQSLSFLSRRPFFDII